MGQEISSHSQFLDKQLGTAIQLLQISSGNQQDHLHDQHHRRLPPTDQKGYKNQGSFCFGKCFDEIHLSGFHADHREINNPRLEQKYYLSKINDYLWRWNYL